MNILSKLKYLLPGRRRALEQDMREELDSLALMAEHDGARSNLGKSLTLAGPDAEAFPKKKLPDGLPSAILLNRQAGLPLFQSLFPK